MKKRLLEGLALLVLASTALLAPTPLLSQQIRPDQIRACPTEGHIIKSVSGVMTCAAETGGGGGAPVDAAYLVQSANGTLTAEVLLNSEASLESLLSDVADVFTDNDGALDDDDLSDDAITALSDVAAKSGTGTTVLFQGSPTLTTPTISSFTNAQHDHTNAAGGGTIAYSSLTSIPSTFAPSAHVLVSATHTVSGLTTGHYLRANSATTYGFAQPAFSELSGSATDSQLPSEVSYDDEASAQGNRVRAHRRGDNIRPASAAVRYCEI